MSDDELAALEAKIRAWQPDELEKMFLWPCFNLSFGDEQMKVTYKTPNGRLVFELEVTTGKQAFATVAAIQELFEEPNCGACKSANISCNAREYDGNQYYKMLCLDCGAQLDFGQKKDGKGMWAKRNDKEGKQMPNRGWYHWKSGRTEGQAGGGVHYEAEPSEPEYESTPF